LGGAERARQLVKALEPKRRNFLVKFFNNEAYDTTNGGWGNRMQFIDGPTPDYAFETARLGDKQMATRVRQQLNGMLRMLDPETDTLSTIAQRDWSGPLAAYPMFAQESGLRGFSLGYAMFGDQRYAGAAARIVAFMRDTMSAPDGGIYASMGGASFNPGVDKRRYSRENGKAIAGLVAYFDATQDRTVLDLASRHARWVLQNRRLRNRGFGHDANDTGGPFLADSLEMARALLHLHRSTGDRQWLSEARTTADFMVKHLVDPATGGFLAAANPAGKFMHQAIKQKDDNVLTTRFFNDLCGYTGDKRYREVAEAGMDYLASDAVL
jgi:uncharacterized protein